MLTKALILCLALLLALAGTAQIPSRADRAYKPTTLAEAVAHLHKLHTDSLKQHILTMSEEEFVGRSHLGLGMWLRNNWGLWRGGPLARHLNGLGVYHPDDMSGLILTSYYRDLRHEDWRVAQQITRYQEYSAAAAEHERRWKTDPAYRARLQAQRDSAERAYAQAQLARYQAELLPGKLIEVYIDCQCGLLADGGRTRIEGRVVRWLGNDLELRITRYLDERKKRWVIKCNAVENDLVRLRWQQNYSVPGQ